MVDIKIRKKIREIRMLQSVGKIIFWLGWIFWLLRTVVFMVIYGWHTSAEAGGPEKICDIISGSIMMVGMIILFKSMWTVDKLLLDALEEEVTHEPGRY